MYFITKIGACLCCALLIITIPAKAHSLKGKVTDEKAASVAGAIVSIPDIKAGTTTDADGSYSIGDLPKGKYLVEVRLLGYATASAYININGDVTHDFQLTPSIIEKNEIIVIGTSQATEERRSVSPVQSVRMQELKENASTNIIDALAKQPGISQLSTGPAISKPIIRGLGYNRIITMNDGIRQEGQQWGDEHGIEIDDYNVSKVEILKGPASLAYGSDALAGVINIISDEPLQEGKIDGNIAANYQTNNGLAALHIQNGGNIKGYSWNVYGTGKMAHDYKNDFDGYVQNSRFENVDFGATAGVNHKWGFSHISFTSFSQVLGLVDGSRDSATGRFTKPVNDNGEAGDIPVTDKDGTSYARQLPSQKIDHRKLAWNNSLYLDNGGRLGLILGYQQNVRREYEDVLQPDVPGLNLQLQTFTYDLKYYFPSIQGWQVTTGINGMQQQNKNQGIEFLVPDYKLFDAGIFGIAKKDWEAWSVLGGVRFNYRSITGDVLYLDSMNNHVPALQTGGYEQFSSFDRNFSNMVGSLGASYATGKQMTLKFNLASGFRAPNIAELSANGVHEGSIRYEYGNTSLSPEQSIQADLGMIWNSDHILVNAGVFYNYISNFIFIRQLLAANGEDSIPAAHNEEGFSSFIYGQGNAALYGGELYVDLHPHPFDWLHFENTFSYVRGIMPSGTDSTRNLPAIPAPTWIAELRAQKSNMGKWIKNAYAKAGLDIIFAQNNAYTAYSTETPTAGYTLLNAGIGMDITNKKKNTLFSLNISAKNITDVAYQSHLSRLKYAPVNYTTGRAGVFNTGRNISVLVSVPLQFR